jgi:hypothetical protein
MLWHLTFVVSVQVPLTCISDRIVGTRSSHFAKLQKVVAKFGLVKFFMAHLAVFYLQW